MARTLLDQGADANARSPHDRTSTSWWEGIIWLLGWGPRQPTAYSPTPLMGAASGGYNDLIRLLIKNGADVNMQSRVFGETALTQAVAAGQKETVRLLLDCGARADIQEKDGMTALKYARREHYNEIVALLEKAPSYR